MNKFATAILLLTTVALATVTDTPTATVKITTTKVSPGKPFAGTISINIPSGWHAYQNPPSEAGQIPISISAGSTLKNFKVTYPKGQIRKSLSGAKEAVYFGTVKIPFKATAPARAGKYDIKLAVNYQICDESSCLPPDTLNIKVAIKVVK